MTSGESRTGRSSAGEFVTQPVRGPRRAATASARASMPSRSSPTTGASEGNSVPAATPTVRRSWCRRGLGCSRRSSSPAPARRLHRDRGTPPSPAFGPTRHAVLVPHARQVGLLHRADPDRPRLGSGPVMLGAVVRDGCAADPAADEVWLSGKFRLPRRCDTVDHRSNVGRRPRYRPPGLAASEPWLSRPIVRWQRALPLTCDGQRP